MLKRTTSAFLALSVLALSLTGCTSKPAVVATFDQGEIPAGVYILNEHSQYNQYMSYTGNADLSFKVTEDQTLAQVIEEDALDAMKRYASVESECKRLGITLSEEEMTAISQGAAKNYNDNKDVYSKKGIAQSSVEKTAISNSLSYKLMEKLYGEGGELAVTKEEKEKYLNETYRKAAVIDIPLTNDEGKLLEGEEKENAKKEAKELFASIENGEKSFTEVFKSVNEKKGATVPETEDAKNYSTLITKNDARFAPDFTVSLFSDEAKELRKPFIYEAEASTYIYMVFDVLEDNFVDELGDKLIYEMKNKDFMDYLLKKSEEINLVFDEKALKAYGIKKIAER